MDWNLNETPHALMGGPTGAGKSAAMSIVLFYALYLPGQVEIIVCDPKRTEFPWVTEFPSALRYACTGQEICDAVELARHRLDAARTLLNRTQARNLSALREKYAQDPGLEAQYGHMPKRTVVLFDYIADFLARDADSEVEERKAEARTMLEHIARLGRSPGVNIVCAAQKPSAKIISTQLRSQLGFRRGVGPVDRYESEQILNSNHGTRLPEAGTPKGRAWGFDPKNGYRQAQVMFLPEDPMPCPWDEERTLPGARKLLRHRLATLGSRQTNAETGEGGGAQRWTPPGARS